MSPEVLLPMAIATLLGWGGFTWRKSEDALSRANQAQDLVDKLEIKIAEKYVTKEELKDSVNIVAQELARMREDIARSFDLIREQNKESYNQLTTTLTRVEDKVDYRMSDVNIIDRTQ